MLARWALGRLCVGRGDGAFQVPSSLMLMLEGEKNERLEWRRALEWCIREYLEI